MPQGEETYGSEVGRPPENKNKSKSSKRNSKTARQNRLERNRDNIKKIEERIIRDRKEKEKRLLLKDKRRVDARMRELSDANKEQVALKGTGPDAPSFEVKEKKVLKILDARNRSKKTY